MIFQVKEFINIQTGLAGIQNKKVVVPQRELVRVIGGRF